MTTTLTAKDLITSIIEHHVKSQKALYDQRAGNQAISEMGEKMYGSLSNFLSYMRTHSDSHNIRLTEKQYKYIASLMRKEGVDRIQFDGFMAIIKHPSYPISAVGGFIGKREDTSRHILKLKSIY
jgi:hypothetical protein